jgi:DNA-binding response OmpR family regulator
VENEWQQLRRNVERYRFLLAKVANPALIKLLEQMLAEAEVQIARFDVSWRTNPYSAASTGTGRGTNASWMNLASLAGREPPPRIDDWQLDPQSRTATTPAGKTVRLTKGEFELLLALATHANQTLSRADLMVLSRHRSAHPNERTVDVLIGRLRNKLEVNPRQPQHINTVRNLGYMFKPQSMTDQQ